MKVNDLNEAERYHVGTTIAGRYRVERAIGEGAMGAVALALHVSLDEKVAIEFLRPELRRDPVAIARLSREAKALARIKSDHVTRVIDVGATLALGPYMVMEYLEGTDLGEVLDVEGPLPVERAVELMLQVCEALTVAHTVGITHRDIKPQNLFLARHGGFETLKVLDFGIADDERVAAGRTTQLPSGGHAPAPLYGTPSYMSPERIRNEATADHRSDIWSIGVVLHELVTGRAVFDAPTLTETCALVVSDGAPALEMDDAVLPPNLRSIIARCLEREPPRRYQSVEELAVALAPLGTMRERFRGRSTGAFSRQFLEDQRALSMTERPEPPTPGASPPRSSEPPTSPVDVGAGLRWLRRNLPFSIAYAAPRWSSVGVALASALAFVSLTSVFSAVHWVAPPSTSVRREPLLPSEVGSVPLAPAPPESALSPSSVAPSVIGAATEDGAMPPNAMSSFPAPPLVNAQAKSGRAERGPQPSRRVKPRRKRRAASPATREGNGRVEATADRGHARRTERSSRVRLVEERAVAPRPSGRDAPVGSNGR